MDKNKKSTADEQDLKWLMEMCKEKDKELESVLNYAADGVGQICL